MKYLIIIFLSLTINSFSQDNLDLSYDIGKDLVLLKTNAWEWYISKDFGARNTNNYDGIDPTYINSPSYGYHAIYWNPKSNEYYYATGEESFYNLRETNNLTYKFNHDKQETNYIKSEQEYLQYLGSLDFYTRVYLGKDNKQYIKKLRKINDKIIVKPVLNDPGIYTNSVGDEFFRKLGRYDLDNYDNGELVQL